MADLSDTFRIAAGSTTGSSHYDARQNRQDAWCVESTPRCIAAVVCDGCGDPASPYSEVGAALGARLLARGLCGLGGVGLPLDTALERGRLDLLAHLGVLAGAMGDLDDTVRRYFLFTVIGALITEREAGFFSIGDGLIGVNGSLTKIGPYPENAPPYLAYALIPGHHRSDARTFTVHERIATAKLDSFMLATDGAEPLLDGAGPDVWCGDDLYFRNPAALPNRLRLLATARRRIDWDSHRATTEPGRVQDDATLVLGRRAHEEEASDGDA